MIQEQELIPYESSDLPPGPWLVLAPHPDDDVFGMGGTIALATRKNIRVEVIVMTRGEGAGDPDIRQEESLCAGKVTGVGKYHFRDIPDRGVAQSKLNPGDFQSVLESLKPKTLFLPGIQEFHSDHRGTTKLILPLLKSSGYEDGVWLYEISRQGEANRLVDISQVMDKKTEAIQCFQSQLTQVDYQDVVLGLNRARSYTLGKDVKYAEGFWQCSSVAGFLSEFRTRIDAYFESIKTD